jgi:large subunit ribosomal protein L1
MNIQEALKEIRKEENSRKFDQSVDLIVNLKGVDPKKDNISLVISIPHKIKEKRVCGFLTKKTDLVNSITQPEFAGFKEKKALKRLVKDYDFFIAAAKLMPSVATTFGKVLGPSGKMPSPQLGVLMQEDDNAIKQLLEKISKSVKVRVKEASVKISIGKEKMSDKELSENIDAVYQGIVNALPTKKENVRSVMIKSTMSKAYKVEVK